MTGQARSRVAALAIRRLGLADAPACLMLATQRHWLAEESKWRFLLSIGTGLGIDAPDGGLLGTVVVTRFGSGLAAVGMLLVSPSVARRGLGRRLMQAALQQAGSATVFLYSTAEGRPLYEALGFREVSRVVKYAGQYEPGAGPGVAARVRPAAAADLGDVSRLDMTAFGARRESLLARLGELAEWRYVAVADDGLAGHGAAWRSTAGTVIGPLVATGEPTAVALADALARSAGGSLSLDVPGGCRSLARWAAGCGLRVAGEAPLMVAPGRELPGDRTRLFSPVMQALG